MVDSNILELVVIFDEMKAVQALKYTDFKILLSSQGFPHLKSEQVKAAYVTVENDESAGRKIHSLVLFLFDLNEDGIFERRWNLPLRQFSENASPGPQVGGYQVKLACKSLCSSAWHTHDLWDLPELEARQYLGQIKDAVDEYQWDDSLTVDVHIPTLEESVDTVAVNENKTSTSDNTYTPSLSSNSKSTTTTESEAQRVEVIEPLPMSKVAMPSQVAPAGELPGEPLDIQKNIYAKQLREAYQNKLEQLASVQDQRLRTVKSQYQSQLSVLAKDYKERLVKLQSDAAEQLKAREKEARQVDGLEDQYAAKLEQAQQAYNQKLQHLQKENEKLHVLLAKHQEFTRKAKADRGEQAILVEGLRQENQELSSRLERLGLQYQEIEKRFSTISSENESLREAQEDHLTVSHQEKSELLEKCQRLELQCDQLVEAQEEHHVLHESLSKKHQSLIEDYEALSNKFGRLAEKYGATLREDNQQTAQTDTLRQQCDELEKKVSELDQSLTDSVQANDTWELKYQALQCNYDELQVSFNELERKKVNPYSNVVGINSMKSTREQLAQKDDELARRIAVEQRLRSKILSLNLQIAQLDTQSAEGFVEKLNELGVVSLASLPSGEHLTIMPAQLVEFVDDPIAFSALNTGVPEPVYRAWLAHFELPICTAKNPDGSLCGEQIKRVERASDFVIGQCDRCDKHRPSVTKISDSEPPLTLNT